MSERRLSVLAWPAFRNRAYNPYNALLCEALREAGVTVEEFSPGRLIRERWDIWHIHWPDLVVSQPTFRAAARRGLGFLALLVVARMRGIRVVWTIHNLLPHDARFMRFQRLVRWAFLRSLSGYLSLTETARTEALRMYPRLSTLPGFVTPHGHYRGMYADSIPPHRARESLGLPPDAFVVLFFGQIRPYKNVVRLIEAFKPLRDERVRLIIAGEAPEQKYAAQVRAAADTDPRIACHIAFVPQAEVQLYLRSCDLVVLPYQSVLNSGAALLALSFERPLLVADRGSLVELVDTFGAQWVQAFEGDLTTSHLEQGIAWCRLREGGGGELEEGLRQLDWSRIAEATLRAYRAIAAGGGAAARAAAAD
jgi:beta-1,4-mannosyltransferase